MGNKDETLKTCAGSLYDSRSNQQGQSRHAFVSVGQNETENNETFRSFKIKSSFVNEFMRTFKINVFNRNC